MKLDRVYRRQYAIPDIHGRSDLLELALQKMDDDGYDSKQDLLVFCGDLIDRGPDSKGVIDIIKSLCEADPETVFCLRGNHEDFAVDTYVKRRPHAKDSWYYNGGLQTEQSYPNGYMSEEHLKFLGGCPYSIESQGFFYSHAPVPREKARTGRGPKMDGSDVGGKGEEYTVWELTWYYFGPEGEKPGALMDMHEGPLSNNGLGPDHLVGICGHIHRGSSAITIRSFPKYLMLDTGCGCYLNSPLAVHECLSHRTLYANPADLTE